MRLFTRLIAVALTATMPLSASANERELHIEQGQIVLTADGARLPTSDIAGTEVVIGDPAKGGYRVRINGQIDDPHASQPMRLYDVDFKNRNTGEWEPLCNPGPYGLALAVPVPAVWSRDGRYQPLNDGQFTFNCTSGSHVKCLRMGYAPWKTGPGGESLAPFHQACTRMMRADYCGTGQPQTVAGRQIQLFDRRAALPDRLYGRFEAVWGEDGAICLARARVPHQHPLNEVLNACPRLAEIPADQCDPALLQSHPKALFANRS